jgi:hypothetical protein
VGFSANIWIAIINRDPNQGQYVNIRDSDQVNEEVGCRRRRGGDLRLALRLAPRVSLFLLLD